MVRGEKGTAHVSTSYPDTPRLDSREYGRGCKLSRGRTAEGEQEKVIAEYEEETSPQVELSDIRNNRPALVS